MSKTIINADPDSLDLYLKKIWWHKSLIVTLAKRDLKIKYAQTALGLAWTVLQPLVAVTIYTIFFSGLMNFQTSEPYILFVLSGILLWNLFNYIFAHGSASLTQNQDLIKKLAFPKIILPLSKLILSLVEFSITLILLIALMIYFQVPLRWTMLWAPIILLPLILMSFGLAISLSAATIQKRDLFHIVPFLINFGIWLTPVFYPVSLIPAKYSSLLYLNPIACILQLFRWSLFGEALNPLVLIGLSLSFIIFIVGFFHFKSKEDKIIDVI